MSGLRSCYPPAKAARLCQTNGLPIFSHGASCFRKPHEQLPEIKEVPPGLNFYRESVYALKIYGEVAILYTANDYGDMWQVGLNDKGQIDARRNEQNAFVAINQVIWDNRETYLRNITPSSLDATYKFGTNIVIHLLTRWENKTRTATSL
jgi:hypothetical protein